MQRFKFWPTVRDPGKPDNRECIATILKRHLVSIPDIFNKFLKNTEADTVKLCQHLLTDSKLRSRFWRIWRTKLDSWVSDNILNTAIHKQRKESRLLSNEYWFLLMFFKKWLIYVSSLLKWSSTEKRTFSFRWITLLQSFFVLFFVGKRLLEGGVIIPFSQSARLSLHKIGSILPAQKAAILKNAKSF